MMSSSGSNTKKHSVIHSVVLVLAVLVAIVLPLPVFSLVASAGRPSPSLSLITVLNPRTQRRIRLGGPTYNDLISTGEWVQHEGTLKRLDLKALPTLRDDFRSHDETTETDSGFFQDEASEKDCSDDWHVIRPSVVAESSSPDDQRHRRSLTAAEELQLGEQLLFVYKPAGLHCVPPRDPSVDSLSSQVSQMMMETHPNANPFVRPCHRLDRDTSGIVVFGLTKEAHREVSMQFEARTTRKTYVALVAGHPHTDGGTVDMPIGKTMTREGFNRWTINTNAEKAREAITVWRLDRTYTHAANGATHSRVILEPKTGRGHQLRLHMKAIGCPILGDTIHHDDRAGVAACSPRLCLHAFKLQLDWNGRRLEAESVAPF